ncbi:MAG TPA: CsbD family protein [Polyangia bacterium]|jgi:uncharacterized protein YjbJ (UPF0337 family)|nr:CsbD family protein [Polyangia bacterium]
MNKDELKGKAENLKGRAKEAGGALTGNKQTEAEGMAERAKGAVREKVGQVKKEISRDDIEDSDDE